MSTKRKGPETTENSVNVALRDLMGLEDERRREEEANRRLRDEEEREAREAAALEKQREEEERRRKEEEERLSRERMRAEEEERRLRRDKEMELAVRAREEAAAMAREQARLMEMELEVRRVAASGGRAPGWFWPVAAVLVLCMLGVSTAVYMTVTANAKSRVEDAKRDLEALRSSSDERVSSARTLAKEAARREEEARKALVDLRRANDELMEQNRRLQIATASTGKDRPRAGSAGSRVRESEKDGLFGIAGCTDPLGCGGDLDGLPLDIGKSGKKKR